MVEIGVLPCAARAPAFAPQSLDASRLTLAALLLPFAFGISGMTHRLASDSASENAANSVAVCRTFIFGGGYRFIGGGCDALCINADKPVAVSGISLCNWASGSTSGDVSIYVIEGSSTSGRVLAHRKLLAVQLHVPRYLRGMGIPLMFEHPVHLEPATDYTLALRMLGDMEHAYCVGRPSIRFDRRGESDSRGALPAAPGTVTVTFKDAKVDGPPPDLNLDNGRHNYLADITDHSDCQIPYIYFVLGDAQQQHEGHSGGVVEASVSSSSFFSVAAAANLSSPPAAAAPSAATPSPSPSGEAVLHVPSSLVVVPPASSAAAGEDVPEHLIDE